MQFNIGDLNITAIYYGNVPVHNLYNGEELVWSDSNEINFIYNSTAQTITNTIGETIRSGITYIMDEQISKGVPELFSGQTKTITNHLYLVNEDVETSSLGTPSSSYTISSSSSYYPLSDVVYGNGVYVVGLTKERIAYSTDLQIWNIVRIASISNGGFKVAYGNGVFVAVWAENSYNGCMVSTDGITWNWAGMPATYDVDTFGFFGDRFILTDRASLWYSTDGTNWSSTVDIGTGSYITNYITFDSENNRYISFVPTSTAKIMVSTDGCATWSVLANSSDIEFMGTGIYCNGKWYVSANKDSAYYLYSSTDLTTWTQVYTFDNWDSAVTLQAIDVSLMIYWSIPDYTAKYSKDGITWTSLSMEHTTDYYTARASVAAYLKTSDNKFIIRTGDSGITYCQSMDVIEIHSSETSFLCSGVNTGSIGNTWIENTEDNFGLTAWNNGVFGNNILLAAAQFGGYYGKYSTDGGTTWNDTSIDINKAAFDDGYFYAIGYGNKEIILYRSTDCVNWNSIKTTSTGSTSPTGYGVLFANNSKVILYNLITKVEYFSEDNGTTWSENSPGITLYDIAYGNNMYMALSSTPSTYTVYTSTDGINWTSTGVSVNYGAYLVFVDGYFYWYGNGCYRSTDGVTWTSIPYCDKGFAYGGGYYLLTNSAYRTYYTTDFSTFNEITQLSSNTIYAPMYALNKFISPSWGSSTHLQYIPVTPIGPIEPQGVLNYYDTGHIVTLNSDLDTIISYT